MNSFDSVFEQNWITKLSVISTKWLFLWPWYST